MAGSSLFAFPVSLIFTACGLGLLLLPWLIRSSYLAFVVLFLSLIIGQSLRLPLPGQGGGLLLSDLAVIITILAALLVIVFRHKPLQPTTYNLQPTTYNLPPTTYSLIALSLIPFILWSFFSLAINFSVLGFADFTIALTYWFRLIAHLLLLPALLLILKNNKNWQLGLCGLLTTMAVLVVFGFLQLLIFPELTPFSLKGWDPHQNRLVSTWLDPNFFGGFLALLLPFVLVALSPSMSLLFFFPLLALFLTQSRSSLLALALAVVALSPLIIYQFFRHTNPRRLVIIFCLIALIILVTFTAAIPLRHRLVGLLLADDTVQLRLTSLKQAWPLAADNSLLGIGYNAYQFTAIKTGLISNFNIHSRAGTDNSLLNLWITTGLLGVILFFFPWLVAAHLLFRQWLRGNPYALAALLAIVTLFIHSQFVNSFLYSHLLITLIIIVALALTESGADKL